MWTDGAADVNYDSPPVLRRDLDHSRRVPATELLAVAEPPDLTAKSGSCHSESVSKPPNTLPDLFFFQSRIPQQKSRPRRPFQKVARNSVDSDPA
jgi:hypothetical protein